MSYTVIYDKIALADAYKLKAAKLLGKAQKLCKEIAINPIHPKSKKLYRDLTGKRSIRINLQHRLVYKILEDQKTIEIFRMWGHYDEYNHSSIMLIGYVASTIFFFNL